MHNIFCDLSTGEITTVNFTSQELDFFNAQKALADSKAKDEYNEKMRLNRENAFRAESDILFFKSQRNEATTQEWLDKVAEIRNRFPYQP